MAAPPLRGAAVSQRGAVRAPRSRRRPRPGGGATCSEPSGPPAGRGRLWRDASDLRRDTRGGRPVARGARRLRARGRDRRDAAACAARPEARAHARRRSRPTAVALGLPVLRARRLGADETAALTALDADLAVIVAYGGLVAEPLLSAPRLGWVNLHFSLLPRWRGAAPVQRAVIAGDETTGVEVFQLEKGLDTGPVLASETVAIGALETAGHLLGRLAPIGARRARRDGRPARRRHRGRRAAGGRADARAEARAGRRPARLDASRRTACSRGSAAARPSPAPGRRSATAA